MNKKSPAEMQRSRTIKAYRTLIRLRHSLAADEEINELIPDTLAQFDEALSNGELLELEFGVDDVLGDGHATGQ